MNQEIQEKSLQQDAEQLLQQGRTALMAGDAFNARNAFREASERFPELVDAWIGLSASVPILAEKEQYLQHALELAPEYPEALAALAYVRQLQSEGLRIAPSQVGAGRVHTQEAALIETLPAEESELDAVSTQTSSCYIHPDRETGLHCIQCNRPICGACAKMTPVGQLCPECRKERRPANYKVTNTNIVLALFTAMAVAILASALLAVIPGFGIFLNLILGWMTGQLIIRAVDRVTRLKRGPAIQISVGGGTAVGFVLGAALAITTTMLLSPEARAALAQVPLTSVVPSLFMHVFSDIWLLITAAIATIVAVRGLR